MQKESFVTAGMLQFDIPLFLSSPARNMLHNWCLIDICASLSLIIGVRDSRGHLTCLSLCLFVFVCLLAYCGGQWWSEHSL